MSLVAPATVPKTSIAVLEKLMIGAISIKATEIMIPAAGTPFAEILAKCFFKKESLGASSANWKKWRPAEKIPELREEAAAVNTTKLKTEATALKPAILKTWTKGLVPLVIFPQGMTHMITAKVAM